jgi:hypothetical protein
VSCIWEWIKKGKSYGMIGDGTFWWLCH